MQRAYEKEIGTEVVGALLGDDLAELTYEPLLPYFKDNKNSFRVLVGDFVTTDSGTGIVHMAPGFGEDDCNLCTAQGIRVGLPS